MFRSLSKVNNKINQIRPNLFLGSVEAAYDVENLKKLNITHILTIEDNVLDPAVSSKFTYKFVNLPDLMYSDIISQFEECIAFIESAINKPSGVLVHW